MRFELKTSRLSAGRSNQAKLGDRARPRIKKYNINFIEARRLAWQLFKNTQVLRRAMEPQYAESRPIIPRQLTLIAAAVLAATVVFMAFSELFLGTDMPGWAIPAMAVVFAAFVVLMLVMKLDLEIYEDRVEISYLFRRIEIPMDSIIDSRYGELEKIRSYSAWDLKGVKRKTYTRVGDDCGIAMKIKGKRVTVVSCGDPAAASALLPKEAE